ncbi:hypothetical protein FSP39_003485, partial [Pinctada imbricata]
LPDFCLKARAENTIKQYRYAFNNFCKWCKKYQPAVTPLPASDFHLSMYIIHLTKNGNSATNIQSVCHAISWAHSMAGVKDPCESDLVKLVKEGAIRETSRPIIKKEPVLPEHLIRLIDIFANDNCSLADLRIACMCIVAYAGFLRFSELSQLQRQDIKIFQDHMIISRKVKLTNTNMGATFASHELILKPVQSTF